VFPASTGRDVARNHPDACQPALRSARQKKIINVSLGEGLSPQDLSADRGGGGHDAARGLDLA